MISLRSVEKIYPLKGGVFYVLRNINLEINEGEFVSIMGHPAHTKASSERCAKAHEL